MLFHIYEVWKQRVNPVRWTKVKTHRWLVFDCDTSGGIIYSLVSQMTYNIQEELQPAESF